MVFSKLIPILLCNQFKYNKSSCYLCHQQTTFTEYFLEQRRVSRPTPHELSFLKISSLTKLQLKTKFHSTKSFKILYYFLLDPKIRKFVYNNTIQNRSQLYNNKFIPFTTLEYSVAILKRGWNKSSYTSVV